MNPLEINLIFSLLVIIFFLIQGLMSFKKTQTEERYFLMNRQLSSSEFSYSFAAASTSLATVLFFFTILGLEYGVYIFYAPLTYLIGVWIFNTILLPKISSQGFFENQQNSKTVGTTLGNYIMLRLNSRLLKYTVIVLTLIGMLSILLIELYVGVNIFSVYIKPEYSYVALILLTLVVFIYTCFGGFEAVVKTDKYQYKLILWASLIFLGWLLFELIEKKLLPLSSDFFVKPISIKKGIILPYPLLLNILIVNILLIPSLLRTWQMSSATSNSEIVRLGNIDGAKKTFLLTAIFVLIGILFFKYIFPLSNEPPSLILMFQKLINFPDIIGPYFIFPLFFGACIAALLSTADSALMPIIQSLVQDFSKVKTNRNFPFKKLILVSTLLFIVTLGLYFIVFKVLEFDLINWLFTIFSFLIICSPLVFFTVLSPEKLLKRKFTSTYLFLILILGFLIAIGLSIYGNNIGNINLVMLNSPISCIVISFLYFTYYKINKKYV